MVAGAFVWLAAGLANATVPALSAVGLVVGLLPLALVVQLLHALLRPPARPRQPRDRRGRLRDRPAAARARVPVRPRRRGGDAASRRSPRARHARGDGAGRGRRRADARDRRAAGAAAARGDAGAATRAGAARAVRDRRRRDDAAAEPPARRRPARLLHRAGAAADRRAGRLRRRDGTRRLRADHRRRAAERLARRGRWRSGDVARRRRPALGDSSVALLLWAGEGWVDADGKAAELPADQASRPRRAAGSAAAQPAAASRWSRPTAAVSARSSTTRR